MRLNKITFAVALSAATCFPVAAQSLEQAVAQTLASNPEIRAAYNDFMSAHELTNAAKGDYLPDVDVTAGIGYQEDNEADEDFDARNAEVSIRQLIWDGSITYNDIKRNKSETESLRYQLLSDAQDKALAVVEAYVAVLQAQQVLELSQSNYEVHQKIYKDIKKRADAGIGSTADLSQVDGRLARANTNLLAAQTNLDDKTTEFVRITGEYPSDLQRPEVDNLYIPKSLDEALDLAFKNNPVLYIASNDIDAAQYQYKQAKGEFAPKFDIEATQEWGKEIDYSDADVDETSVMLNMSYNLFNGGSDVAKSKRAAYQINKSKDIRDRSHRMLKEGTRLSWSALELNRKQLGYLQQHVDSSARTVIAYEKQFKIGQRTLLDLLNTENELFESRKNYLAALYDGITARYRVLNATGLLLEEMRVEIPESWQKPAS